MWETHPAITFLLISWFSGCFNYKFFWCVCHGIVRCGNTWLLGRRLEVQVGFHQNHVYMLECLTEPYIVYM